MHRGHRLGMPCRFSGTGLNCLFTQMHGMVVLPTATEAAAQRFFLLPGPPMSAGAPRPCFFWMPRHTLTPTSWHAGRATWPFSA